jgi:hypothetical protein
MMDYDGNEDLNTVAQFCRNFSAKTFSAERSLVKDEGLSCRSCTNWSGSQCSVNSFDSILTLLDM